MSTRVHVLHVDDDPEFTELTAEMLKREDDRFVIETATSAEEGADRLAEIDFDCIVSDYEMPRTDGIEFLKIVREEYPDLPFILYTGKGSEEVASDAISAGVTDYLQKGRGTDQYTILANRITNVVESSRSRRKLAERNKELRRYKDMINSMQEAACIYDADGRFEVVNEYLANWYDTTREALEGEYSNLIPAIREQTGGDDPYQALLDGQRDHLSGEIGQDFPGHGHAVLEYQLTPLIVEGDVDGVVGVARDITERKEREQELRLKNRAMDEAPFGILITDPSREDNPIIYANESFEDLTGYDEDEILGHNCRFLQGEDTDPEAVVTMREAINAQEPVTVELRNYRKDSTMFWNRVRIAPIKHQDGTVRNWVGFQEDITERKESEEELQRQKERLEKFASVVSHDLQNPLNTATGYLELAQEECDCDHLDGVARAHARMDALIENLLALAREGERVDETDVVNLADISERCWQSLETVNATLVTETEQRIRAKPCWLTQLLENLFRNAVEHGGEDVTVTVGEIADGFYVADDGPGIPDDEREEVFTAGYSSTETGAGLGLEIVQEIAEVHEWGIRVTESRAGGTRFEITGVESVDS